MAKKIPLRQCVGCGEMKGKKDMMRVLKTDDGICLDATGKKNGRGAYICRDMECFLKAQKKRSLERSLKCSISEEIYERLRQEIEGL